MSYGQEAEMAIQSRASRVQRFCVAARDVLGPYRQPYSAFAPTVSGCRCRGRSRSPDKDSLSHCACRST